jgi:GH35 family endo-1,4-beta-xylanase
VRVVDAAGKPVKGATVRVRMTRHAFPLGTTVNAFYLLGGEDTDDLRRYKEEIPRLFNFAVLEGNLKWPSWSRDPTVAIRAVDWLGEEGLDVRGHVLVWPRFYHSPWRSNADEIAYLKENPEELRKRITDHITHEVSTLRGKIVEWDVINEPYWNHEYMDLLGDEVMVEWFRTAHEADPAIPLFLNDNGILASEGELDSPHQQHYEKTVRYLLENGAPLGGLGMQGHVKWVVTPPEKLLTILDRFAEFGLPIVVSEYDHDVADEEYQENYMRDFLTVIFSHPSVRGFLMWGFWDGKHWLGNAPLYRKDWSLKPSGEVYKDLVFNQWWTDEEAETDRNGEMKVRGFLGEYEVTVEGRKEVEDVTVGEGVTVGKVKNVVVVEMAPSPRRDRGSE